MNFELWKVLSENKKNPIAEFFLLNKNSDKFASDEILNDELFRKEIIETAIQSVSSAYVKGKTDRKSDQLKDADLRLEYLIVDGFKAIPHPLTSGKHKESSPYGITFNSEHFRGRNIDKTTDDNHLKAVKLSDPEFCTSLVLLGSNGSGKTSLYSAIELVCTGKIATERKHRTNTNAGRSHVKVSTNDSDIGFKITLKTLCDKYNVLNYIGPDKSEANSNVLDLIGRIDLSPFFCSESDLAIFECSGKPITEYIDEICGLGEIIRVKKLCEKLLDSDESSEDDKNKIEQIAAFLTQLIPSLDSAIQEIRDTVLTQAQIILEKLLEDFTDEVVVLNSLKTVDGKSYFDGLLRNKFTNELISPRNYYNNFRLKLYLICLRIGVAFYIMKRRKIQFPLIFDDIFDSSDFPNRIYTKKLFSKILNLYSTLRISSKMLQIIFFTQDEVIAESVFNGICTEINENERKEDSINQKRQFVYKSGTAILGRLFFPEEVEETDRIKIGRKISFNNLYDSIKKRKYVLKILQNEQ